MLAAQGQKNLIVTPATKGEKEIVERFIAKHLRSTLKNGFLYVTKDGVYFNQRNLGPLAEYFFFVHAGTKIGTIKGNTFTPTHHLWWCLEEVSHIPEFLISSKQWAGNVGHKSIIMDVQDGYYKISYGRGTVGICLVQNQVLITKNLQ